MQIRLIVNIGVVLSLSLTIGSPTVAEVRQGNNVLIAKEETIEDDVYVFAQEVIVDGTIKGDLVAFGRQITINGMVDGDLIVAAQQVVVNGKIGDDVRVGGQVLTLQDGADIGDDLIAAGHSLECTNGSRIGGEVKFAGYQSVLAGSVDRKVSLASANCKLSGRFGDDVDAVVDGGNYGPVGAWGAEFPAIPMGLTVSDSAKIAGNLNYQSTSEASIDPESTIAGEVTHTGIASDVDQSLTITDRFVAFVKQFFALLLVGIPVIYLCPKWTGQVVNNVGCRPLASLGWGMITLVILITAAVLLLVATIAIAVLLGSVSLDNLVPAWLWLGLLTTAVVTVGFWIFSAWVAKIIISVWAGNRIINGPDWSSQQRFFVLGVGALIVSAIVWIPVVGAAFSVVVMLIGIGSTTIWLFTKSDRHAARKEFVSNTGKLSPDRAALQPTAEKLQASQI